MVQHGENIQMQEKYFCVHKKKKQCSNLLQNNCHMMLKN